MGARFPLRNLARLRQARGLSQQSLAERCGMAGSTISIYEHGRRDAKPGHAERLASELGVSVLELYGLREADDDEDRAPDTVAVG